jgi:DNA-binding transcriptional ArsR family regulator
MTTPLLPHRTFAALGDPTRLDIVARLSAGPASVSELAEPTALSLRGVLKHVSVLEEAGLVRTVKVGRTRECRLDGDALDGAARALDELRARWERRLDRIERLARGKEQR